MVAGGDCRMVSLSGAQVPGDDDDAEAGKGRLWKLEQTLEQPLGDEAGQVSSMWTQQKEMSKSTTLQLAFLSLGVVYGDVGTSPLYVFSSIFPDAIENTEDVIGTLSLVLYSVMLIPLIKYVFIALRWNDNGEGGTFALYSLICRHVKVNTIPNQRPSDKKLTTYRCREVPEKSFAHKLKSKLEASPTLQKLLLLLVLLGTSMVIGDGILSPAISVLSSVKGIQAAHASLPEGVTLLISLVILVVLFSLQRCGTGKVAFMFAPIILIWFVSIGLIGIYNIAVHEPRIFKAFSPHCFISYFKRAKTKAWISLGGVLLSITGAEALFADLGHFSTVSIQLTFTFLVFPCLLFAYMGQAAFLTKHPQHVADAFYSSLPGPLYWPIFVIATGAAIIASQATISATFSIVKQAVALGCFPRVKIVHTSHRFLGQIYVPEVNWILMVLCLGVTSGFRSTTQIGNAYGVAVVGVMLVTTLLMALLMVIVWNTNLLLVVTFLVIFGTVESVYVTAALVKVTKGGWVPLAFGSLLLLIMFTWHYGSVQRYESEMRNRVPLSWLLSLGEALGMVRLPGIGLFYTELATGVPSIFSHFLTHFPAVHSVLVFICVKYLPVSTVPQKERFLVRRVGPKPLSFYRCVVRYGYMDLHKRDDESDELLMEALAAFLKLEALAEDCGSSVSGLTSGTTTMTSCNVNGGTLSGTTTMTNCNTNGGQSFSLSKEVASSSMSDHHQDEAHSAGQYQEQVRCLFKASSSTLSITTSRDDDYEGEDDEGQGNMFSALEHLQNAREQGGLVHILGNTSLKATEGSSWFRKVAINHGYNFLWRICRDNSVVYHIPHESLLHVGMVYNV